MRIGFWLLSCNPKRSRRTSSLTAQLMPHARQRSQNMTVNVQDKSISRPIAHGSGNSTSRETKKLQIDSERDNGRCFMSWLPTRYAGWPLIEPLRVNPINLQPSHESTIKLVTSLVSRSGEMALRQELYCFKHSQETTPLYPDYTKLHTNMSYMTIRTVTSYGRFDTNNYSH